MQEKRAQKRFDLSLVSRLRCAQGKPDAAPREVKTRNLSCRGAFFVSPDALPLGTKLSMQLILPVSRLTNGFQDSQLACSGTVVRHDPDGFAVSFDKSCSLSPLKLRPA